METKAKNSGIEKVSAKGDLMQKLEKFTAEKVATATAKKQTLWKQDFKNAIKNKFNCKSETRVRSIIRDKYQYPLSLNIVTKAKNSVLLPDSLEKYCKDLKEFYEMSLTNFSQYTNKRDDSEKKQTIISAYDIMKKTLKLS